MATNMIDSKTAREENWLTLLRTFYRMFQEAVELSVVFQRVYELFPPFLNVSRASILLYDPALDALVSGDYIGATQPGESHLKSEPQPIGHSISGLCFQHARPIIVHDATQSDIIPQKFVDRLGIKSALAVPIMFGAKPIGVLRVDDRDNTHRFTDELTEWVQLLAEQLAVVIENARLYSSLKQRERDLRRISGDLLSAKDSATQMVQAKSSFLARVSHELRTPLNAILGYSELLREDAQAQGRTEFGNDINKIQTAATHLMAVITDLLDLSTLEAGKASVRKDSINLQKVIEDALRTSSRSLKRRNNSVRIENPCNVQQCSGDPAKLHEVLYNIITYAARLAQETELTLLVKQHDSADVRLVELVLTQPRLALKAEELNRLFHSFQENEMAADLEEPSSRPGSSGKSLGLTIAQHLCRRMGGELAAFSDPAHGTAFVIRLPGVVD